MRKNIIDHEYHTRVTHDFQIEANTMTMKKNFQFYPLTFMIEALIIEPSLCNEFNMVVFSSFLHIPLWSQEIL